jgi:hypothetical protein
MVELHLVHDVHINIRQNQNSKMIYLGYISLLLGTEAMGTDREQWRPSTNSELKRLPAFVMLFLLMTTCFSCFRL